MFDREHLLDESLSRQKLLNNPDAIKYFEQIKYSFMYFCRKMADAKLEGDWQYYRGQMAAYLNFIEEPEKVIRLVEEMRRKEAKVK